MRTLRNIADPLLLLAATALIYFSCVRPMICNIELAMARGRIEAMNADPLDDRAAVRARRILRDLQTYHPDRSQLLELMMGEANCKQTLQLFGEAAALYARALNDVDRRPELYLNLGVVLARLGQTARAIDNLAAAGFFDPYILAAIEDPQLREKVQVIVSNYGLGGRPTYERVMAALRRGDLL